jgi:hypothetical protein
MSALWSARVLRKDDLRIAIELRAIHPDSGEFSTAKRFALRLLYDEAYDYGPGSVLRSRGPLSGAIVLDQTFDDAFMDANAGRFIARVSVEVHRPPIALAAITARIDREVTDLGVRRDDHAVWAARWDERWKAFWAEPANLPLAAYTIDATDPRWLAHLAADQTWESAAY